MREMPLEAMSMVNAFDKLGVDCLFQDRLKLPEMSFEVDFPDEMVEQIGIDELNTILSKSQTLEAV